MSALPPFDSCGFYTGNREPCEPPDENEIATALAYLVLLGPALKGTVSSYGLKHSAERWGSLNGMSPYVSNGALIAAAIRLDRVVIPTGINAMIGVSRRDHVRRTEADIDKRGW